MSLPWQAAILSYRQYWEVPTKTYYHHLVSLITSQEVRFATGRAIRQALYSAIAPETEFTAINLTREILVGSGLSSARIETILVLSKLKEVTPKTAAAVPGIGKWTQKGAALLAGLDTQVVLEEDKWISARLQELTGVKRTPTQIRALFATHYASVPSLMTYFLWRIQPSGIAKWKAGQPLSREDFV